MKRREIALISTNHPHPNSQHHPTPTRRHFILVNRTSNRYSVLRQVVFPLPASFSSSSSTSFLFLFFLFLLLPHHQRHHRNQHFLLLPNIIIIIIVSVVCVKWSEESLSASVKDGWEGGYQQWMFANIFCRCQGHVAWHMADRWARLLHLSMEEGDTRMANRGSVCREKRRPHLLFRRRVAPETRPINANIDN